MHALMCIWMNAQGGDDCMPGSNFGELGIVFQKELKVPAARRTLSPSMHRISCCVPRAPLPKYSEDWLPE
jgi:hypothetical protein